LINFVFYEVISYLIFKKQLKIKGFRFKEILM
jgi:hypothetical protein